MGWIRKEREGKEGKGVRRKREGKGYPRNKNNGYGPALTTAYY